LIFYKSTDRTQGVPKKCPLVIENLVRLTHNFQ